MKRIDDFLKTLENNNRLILTTDEYKTVVTPKELMKLLGKENFNIITIDDGKILNKHLSSFNNIVIADEDNAVVIVPKIFRMFLNGPNYIPINFCVFHIVS